MMTVWRRSLRYISHMYNADGVFADHDRWHKERVKAECCLFVLKRVFYSNVRYSINDTKYVCFLQPNRCDTLSPSNLNMLILGTERKS